MLRVLQNKQPQLRGVPPPRSLSSFRDTPSTFLRTNISWQWRGLLLCICPVCVCVIAGCTSVRALQTCSSVQLLTCARSWSQPPGLMRTTIWDYQSSDQDCQWLSSRWPLSPAARSHILAGTWRPNVFDRTPVLVPGAVIPPSVDYRHLHLTDSTSVGLLIWVLLSKSATRRAEMTTFGHLWHMEVMVNMFWGTRVQCEVTEVNRRTGEHAAASEPMEPSRCSCWSPLDPLKGGGGSVWTHSSAGGPQQTWLPSLSLRCPNTSQLEEPSHQVIALLTPQVTKQAKQKKNSSSVRKQILVSGIWASRPEKLRDKEVFLQSYNDALISGQTKTFPWKNVSHLWYNKIGYRPLPGQHLTWARPDPSCWDETSTREDPGPLTLTRANPQTTQNGGGGRVKGSAESITLFCLKGIKKNKLLLHIKEQKAIF